jgi:adenylate kinase
MDKVIYLDIPDDIVFERVMMRAKIGEGSGFTKRVDDNPEALKVRLREYHEKTKPLLEMYRKKGILLTVEASGPVEVIYAEVRRRLGLAEPPRPR